VPRGSLYEFPSEAIAKIVEARRTNPTVLAKRAVAFMKHVREVFDHELRPTELAVIVVPLWTFGEPPI
jgi:hypothetical protein